MAREIDRSKRLSKEDAKYLSDRGLLSAEEEAKYGIKPVTDGGVSTLGPNTGDADTVVAPEEDPNEENLPDDYNEWPKSALQAEAEARSLSKSGTIAELAARLEADDAEPDEEEDEEGSEEDSEEEE